MPSDAPAYLETRARGLLAEKIRKAFDILASCTLCPRSCNVNRLEGGTGVCKTADKAVVSSYSPHFGEESPLAGSGGSGTIFMTHCNLLCNFCQNHDISHEGDGREAAHEQLAGMMLYLQKAGCHNINFVTPTHVVPQILAAVDMAAENGLTVPLVYNTSGYDRVETLQLLEGVFDIYMPDFKFWDSDIAEATCKAEDYPDVARKALIEMHRQVGDLVLDDGGLARRGLLIRHLVLPGGLAGTPEIMRFIAGEISSESYVNIMPQYRPCGRAAETEGMGVRLSQKDFESALQAAREAGVTRLDNRRRVFMVF